ncbi:MAG: hypothetical protein Q9160_004972 [Pyrenula sp. 1 TL-2023]
MPTTVEPYNPQWPRQFAQIKGELEGFLAEVDFVSIEHVGSTSIPGLAAKPILDIDIVVTKDQLEPVISALQTNGGYLYMGELGIPDRHAFRTPLQYPTRNLYVCIQDSAALRNHIAVRDLLKRDEDLRKEYGDLKLSLSQDNVEIHEYMTRKNAMVWRLLELSGGVSKEEIEEIRNANQAGERFAPVRTQSLLLREFVIGDLEGLHKLLLASNDEVDQYPNQSSDTMKEAEKLIVEIIQDAGKVPREHIELAVLLVHNLSQETNSVVARFIGRVGARISSCETQDGSRPSQTRLLASLCCSLSPESRRHGLDIEAMKAFIPLLQTMPAANKDGQVVEIVFSIESDTADSTTRGLAENLGFVRIEHKTLNANGKLVYQARGDQIQTRNIPQVFF